MAVWYIVNGKKVDPNGRPYTGDEPNTPEMPQVTNGRDLEPGPEELDPDAPVAESPAKAPKASAKAPVTGDVTL